MDKKHLSSSNGRQTVTKNGGACGVLNATGERSAVKSNVEDMFMLNDGTRLDKARLNGIMPVFKDNYMLDLQKLPVEVREHIEKSNNTSLGEDEEPFRNISFQDGNILTNYCLTKHSNHVTIIDIFRYKLTDEGKHESIGEIDCILEGDNFVLRRMELVENGRKTNIRYLNHENETVIVDERWSKRTSGIVEGYRISGKIDDKFIHASQKFKLINGHASLIEENFSIDGKKTSLDDMKNYLISTGTTLKSNYPNKLQWYGDIHARICLLRSDTISAILSH